MRHNKNNATTGDLSRYLDQALSANTQRAYQADWADSDAIQALQATQANTARRDAAAQRVCSQARGPNSEARWTIEGDLVCTTRRGLVAIK